MFIPCEVVKRTSFKGDDGEVYVDVELAYALIEGDASIAKSASATYRFKESESGLFAIGQRFDFAPIPL